tara:strand:- start:916 stop:1353 length:438 start_codon:yes stop_codon:yes gene_type:complete
MSDININKNEYSKEIDDACFSSYNKGQEFLRSLTFHTASLFGMGEVLSRTPLGTSKIDDVMKKVADEIKRNRWIITEKLFEKQLQGEQDMIYVLQAILKIMNEKVVYYEKEYKPQFNKVMLLNIFQLILFFIIIFSLITMIDWNT